MGAEKLSSSRGFTLESNFSDDGKKRIKASLSFEDFCMVNNLCLETEDTPLSELAESDTRRAYKLCKVGLGHLASSGTTSLVIDNIDANSQTTLPSNLPKTELGQKTHEVINARLPDEDIAEFDFSIGVYPSAEDAEMLGMSRSEIVMSVDMHVEPPDLASC